MIFGSFRSFLKTRCWAMCLLALYALFLAGCSFTTNQSTLDPKGPVARIQLEVFWVTVWVSLFIFVIVGGLLVWVVLRYRERPGDDAKPLPTQGHGNPLIEIGLIGASIGLLVIIAVPTLRAIWYTHEIPEQSSNYQASQLGSWYPGEIQADLEEEILEITVYGWQWWWSFEYPQFGITTANEMALPVGKIVKLNLRAVDVIHSFWLPKLAGKVDLIPGRSNWMWLQAGESFDDWLEQQAPGWADGQSEDALLTSHRRYLEEEIIGHYYGQCAEFCGEAHAYMLFRADVLSEEDFAAWIEKYQTGAPAPGLFTAEKEEEPESKIEAYRQDWAAWQTATRESPDDFIEDPVSQGAMLFMGRAQCIMCHKISNSPAAGALGPDLTHVGSRRSLGAGILDNRDIHGEIDPEKQLNNLVEWISRSQHYKPGSLMYYTDRGLQNLKFTGVTWQKLQSVGLTERDLSQAGLSREQIREAVEEPNADFSGITTRRQLSALLSGLDDTQLTQVSNWPSQEDFRKIAQFLQTLK